MPANFAALPKDHEFLPTAFTLSEEWVNAYIEAVDDHAIAAVGDTFVPPMALVALSIRALIEGSPLPPGTLHAGQELAFHRAVGIGEQLTVGARVVSRGERAGWVLLSVDFGVSSGGEDVMNGRATITFPIES
jgi:acyl dehydratase